jgi:microcystin-dependent protein
MPRILKTLETIALKFTGGSPGSGKVITGDGSGNAAWNYVSNTNVDSNAGISVSKLASGSPNQIILAGQTGTPEFGYMAIDVPIGTVVPYMFPNAPVGFLVCDGATLSRTGYADLFSLANASGLIGTVFGAGDGTTTFSLPDMRGRTIVGVGTNADVSTLGASDNLSVASRTPKHTHTVPAHYHDRGTLAVAVTGTIGTTNTDHTHNQKNSIGGGAQVGSSGVLTADPNGQNSASTTSGMNNNNSHSHTFTGSATTSGLVGATGGASGDSTMATATTTVPYIALNYIIKATYSTLLGDSNAEANEAFTVFMG